METLRLTIALNDYDHTRALMVALRSSSTGIRRAMASFFIASSPRLRSSRLRLPTPLLTEFMNVRKWL